jgi:hypothetical protein
VIFPPNQKKKQEFWQPEKKTKQKQKQINPGPNSVDGNLDEVETFKQCENEFTFLDLYIYAHDRALNQVLVTNSTWCKYVHWRSSAFKTCQRSKERV